MLEIFLLCAIGSVADLIKIGLETLEGTGVPEVSFRIFMKGSVMAYPYHMLKRVRAGKK